MTVPIAKARAARAPGALSGYMIRKQRDEARADKLRDHLYALATRAESQTTQLAAAVAFLNRVEGMPVARNINVNVNDVANLTDAELRAEYTSLDRAARDFAAGDAPEGLPN